jgi:copper chaperone CopZ
MSKIQVQLEPTDEHPVPYDTTSDEAGDLLEEILVAGNTAELQQMLGADIQVDPDTIDEEQRLLEEVVRKRKTQNLSRPTTAFAATAFLKTYGQQLALDAAQARAAVTNKLMEIANCGDTRYELKALELLGKHKDIGIFVDRSEVTVNYRDPAALEDEIKERVKRLLNATVVETIPTGSDLDDELGVFVGNVETTETDKTTDDGEEPDGEVSGEV